MAGSARGSLSATHKSDSKRCCRSLEEVHAADGSGSGISHPEERVGHPTAVPSTGKASEGPRAGSVSRLRSAGDAQASAEAEWFRVLAGRSAETAGRDPHMRHGTANGRRARDLVATHHQARWRAADDSLPTSS